MNDTQTMLFDAITHLIQKATNIWPAAWKNEFRNLLIEWLQDNL